MSATGAAAVAGALALDGLVDETPNRIHPVGLFGRAVAAVDRVWPAPPGRRRASSSPRPPCSPRRVSGRSPKTGEPSPAPIGGSSSALIVTTTSCSEREPTSGWSYSTVRATVHILPRLYIRRFPGMLT